MRDLRLIVLGDPPHPRQSIDLGAQPGQNAGTLLDQSLAMSFAVAIRFCRFLHADTDWFQQPIKVLERIQYNFRREGAISYPVVLLTSDSAVRQLEFLRNPLSPRLNLLVGTLSRT